MYTSSCTCQIEQTHYPSYPSMSDAETEPMGNSPYDDILVSAARIGDMQILDIAISKGATDYAAAIVEAHLNDHEEIINKLIPLCDAEMLIYRLIPEAPTRAQSLIKSSGALMFGDFYIAATKEAQPALAKWLLNKLQAGHQPGSYDHMLIQGLINAIRSMSIETIDLAWEACAGIEDRDMCIIGEKYKRFNESNSMRMFRYFADDNAVQHILGDLKVKIERSDWETLASWVTDWEWIKNYEAINPDLEGVGNRFAPKGARVKAWTNGKPQKTA